MCNLRHRPCPGDSKYGLHTAAELTLLTKMLWPACRRDYGNRQFEGGGHRGGRGGGGGYHGGGRGDYRRDGGGGGGGGGGGYRGRGEGRRGGGPRFQSSYVGQKRGRDEPEPVDPKKQLIQRLLKLGEPGPLSEVRCLVGLLPPSAAAAVSRDTMCLNYLLMCQVGC